MNPQHATNSTSGRAATTSSQDSVREGVPGRPITYGTSEEFISHFGLEQLGDLPGLDELKGSGMLDGRLPPNFSVPVPSDDPALREDEDPLEPGDLDLGLAPRVESTEE